MKGYNQQAIKEMEEVYTNAKTEDELAAGITQIINKYTVRKVEVRKNKYKYPTIRFLDKDDLLICEIEKPD